MALVSRGWYTFMAAELSDKGQIASAVKELYKVDVLEVRTVSMHGKSRRFGKKARAVLTPDWKKAVVRVKQGQTIDAFSIGGDQQQG